MTEPTTPGGAGLPEQPVPAPATPPDATPPDATPDDAMLPDPAWAAPVAEPAPEITPLEGSAGFGMPLGMDADPTAVPDPGGDQSGLGGLPAAAAEPGAPEGWIPGAVPAGGMAAGATLIPAKRGRPIRVLVVIGVIVVIIGVVLFLTKDQKNASDLAVGDCFEVPSSSVDIDTVKSGPCNQSHTGEIFFVTNYPDAAAYPADTDFEKFAEDNCNPVYTTYVGASLDATPDLTVGFFYPQADGWSSGDRVMKCYVTRVDGGPITQSLKGSGGSGQ